MTNRTNRRNRTARANRTHRTSNTPRTSRTHRTQRRNGKHVTHTNIIIIEQTGQVELIWQTRHIGQNRTITHRANGRNSKVDLIGQVEHTERVEQPI